MKLRAAAFFFCFAWCTSSLSFSQSSPGAYPFRDSSLDLEKRIDNVLSLMTLDEKIAGLDTTGVKVPRLGIPGTPIGEALSGLPWVARLQASLP